MEVRLPLVYHRQTQSWSPSNRWAQPSSELCLSQPTQQPPSNSSSKTTFSRCNPPHLMQPQPKGTQLWPKQGIRDVVTSNSSSSTTQRINLVKEAPPPVLTMSVDTSKCKVLSPSNRIGTREVLVATNVESKALTSSNNNCSPRQPRRESNPSRCSRPLRQHLRLCRMRHKPSHSSRHHRRSRSNMPPPQSSRTPMVRSWQVVMSSR